MIKICTMEETLIKEDAWDFTIEELDYLLREHSGETFVLMEDRLWEAENKYESKYSKF